MVPMASHPQVRSRQQGEVLLDFPDNEHYFHEIVAERKFYHELCFLQGFTFLPSGQLLYGSGLWRHSQLRVGQLFPQQNRVAIVQVSPNLPNGDFGEGVAGLDGLIYQLTYKSRLIYIFNATTLTQLSVNKLPEDGPREGWGLTTDGTSLFATDGSSNLFQLDLRDFHVKRKLLVRDRDDRPVHNLNELEFINGEIFANIYKCSCIVRINPATGDVLGWLFGASLWPSNPAPAVSVFNGIAFNPQSKIILMSGKMWSFAVQVKFSPVTASRHRAHRECHPFSFSASDSVYWAALTNALGI